MEDLIEVIVKDSKPDFASGQYKVVLQDKKTDISVRHHNQIEGGG